MRWRVERAGWITDYQPGWFARNEWLETGAWFATWNEAWEFADHQARENLRAQLPNILKRWNIDSPLTV